MCADFLHTLLDVSLITIWRTPLPFCPKVCCDWNQRNARIERIEAGVAEK